MLLLFGVGGAAGMVIGGRLGDWKPLESIAALSLAYAVFYLVLIAVVDSVALVAAATTSGAFVPCPRPAATRVVRKAIDGPNLASTLNQSAFNVGNALGQPLAPQRFRLWFRIIAACRGSARSSRSSALRPLSFLARSNVRKLSSSTRGVVVGPSDRDWRTRLGVEGAASPLFVQATERGRRAAPPNAAKPSKSMVQVAVRAAAVETSVIVGATVVWTITPTPTTGGGRLDQEMENMAMGFVDPDAHFGSSAAGAPMQTLPEMSRT